MKSESRRTFLKSTALAGGATALTQSGVVPVAAAAEKPAMAIARWKGEAAAEDQLKPVAQKLTRQAIDALGGMKRFVKKGDVVWIKPNMAWDRTPAQAANTNPDLVATLIEMCFEAGAKKVKVGDRTCNADKKSYPRSGIESAAKAAGAEVLYLDEDRFKEMKIGGKRLDKWPVYPEIVDADVVINCPIVKHHSIAKATMCMKNYMGVIGGKRAQWHQDIETCLADITRFMKPTLCILDAIRVLTDHGPSGGDLKDVKRLDTVVAGTDIVAMDAFGGELLGHEIGTLSTVKYAHEVGLGEMDYHKLSPKEIAVT